LNLCEKLEKLGVEIPSANIPTGAYSPVSRSGNLVFTSGQTPRRGGVLCYTGRLGENITLEQGISSAKQCAINCLALINDLAGGLDNIDQIIRVTGYVNCTPDFFKQSQVIDGASEFLIALFGENGTHARSAIGVCALPGNAPCEVEMIVRVKTLPDTDQFRRDSAIGK